MTTFRQDIRLGKKVPLMKTDDYDDKSITTEKLADYSVTSVKLKDEAVITSKIAEGAVTSTEIAPGAVETINIDKGAVTSNELDDGAVITEKLKNLSVTTNKIDDKAVTSAKLGDESVLVSKIAQEVWDKLIDEYLRLDGLEEMKGDIGMNEHAIENLSYISGMNRASIRFFNPTYPMMFMCTVDGDAEDELAVFTDSKDFDVTNGKAIAEGFKTHNRTNIGLLGNDGTVGLALNDSEIDSITSSVFTNYDNITE